MKYTVKIINIGNELLSGRTINTNLAFLGKEMLLLGYEISETYIIPDSKESILKTLGIVWTDFSIVVVTGGLGPTKDDITKASLAEFFNKELIYDEKILNDIKEIYRARNITMPEINKVQAYIPKDFTALSNSVGTAPGMFYQECTDGVQPSTVAAISDRHSTDSVPPSSVAAISDRHSTDSVPPSPPTRFLFSLPGVPFEMEHLFKKYVKDYIQNNLQEKKVHTYDINTLGIGESKTAELLDDLKLENDVNIAWLPGLGRVDIRLSGANQDGIFKATSQIKQKIGDYIWGYNYKSPAEALHQLLVESKHFTISTAESCTGGLLSTSLTNFSGSSKYFLGSVVAYSNDTKVNILGVSIEVINNCGAVSEETAVEMLNGCKKIFNTDISCAITGIAGPEGGSETKPVGTVYIGVRFQDKTVVEKCFFTGSREQIRQKATDKAFVMILQSYRRRPAVDK